MGLKDISFSFQRTYAGFSFLFSWNRAMRFNGLIPRKENNTSKSGLAGVWCDQYLCLTGRTAVFCCDTPTVLTVYIFKMSTGQTLKLTMRNYTFTVRYILDNVSVTFHTCHDSTCSAFLIKMESTEKTRTPELKSLWCNRYCIFLVCLKLFQLLSTVGYVRVFSSRVFIDLCTPSIPQTPEPTVHLKSAGVTGALKPNAVETQITYVGPALPRVDDIIKCVPLAVDKMKTIPDLKN